jgi:hypothetical protein
MVEIEQRRVRKNGFDCPWHPTQVFTYVLFLGDIVSFYGIDMVCLWAYESKALLIALSTAYAILSIGTAYYGYLATVKNPTDQTIQLELDCKRNNI